MPVVTLNPNVKPSAGQCSYISPTPAARSRLGPYFTYIEGPLPNGKWLTPIWVRIIEENSEEGEDREFVITEAKYYMHGVGKTVPDAVEAFKRILLQYLDGLTERENRLSPWVHEQLAYLRSVIRISR
jgi:hypothetical protein